MYLNLYVPCNIQNTISFPAVSISLDMSTHLSAPDGAGGGGGDPVPPPAPSSSSSSQQLQSSSSGSLVQWPNRREDYELLDVIGMCKHLYAVVFFLSII